MPLSQLPLDVLDVLCQFIDQPDLVALAVASPLFCPFAQRYLYRRIALTKPAHAVRCFKTLRRRPELARHVRTLSLRLDPNASLLRPFVDLLGAGIAHMHNLASLDVVIPQAASRAFFAAETHGTFYSRLAHFSCNLPLDESVCSFLQRVPAVKELQLGEHAASLSSSSSRTPSAHVLPASALPNLACYMGPSDAAAVLVPGRPLESVHLYPGELSEQVLDALSRTSSPITVFGALTHSLSPSILRSLAQSLPHLHFLRIMTMYHASDQPDETFYGQVVQILSTLPELVSAELAGFRWFSWKDAAAEGGHVKPSPARAHAAAATPNESPGEDAIDTGLY